MLPRKALGALLLLVIACGGTSLSTTTLPESLADAVSSTQATTLASPNYDDESTTTSSTSDGTVDSEADADVVGFTWSLIDLLVDTEYADAILEDPEVFVATGYLFCEGLEQGQSPAEILSKYVETITNGDIEDAPDEVLVLAGSLLGTAVGYLCPEFSELLETSLRP